MKQSEEENKTATMLVHSEQKYHSGPIPSPEILRGYQSIDSSFPERIMKMAEANNAASIDDDKK